MMSLFIKKIANKPVASNSYVIYTKVSKACIIVDPGTEDCVDLISFLDKKKLIPEYIFLTHEHFDHIWGVNKLKEIYNPKLICSKDCSARIIDNKKNLSVFYDQVGFEACNADIPIENINYKLSWNNYNFEFIPTKGHSEGAICIYVENYLFSGDTLIKGEKTVTKLPGGSKEKLEESILRLKNKIKNKQVKVFPGHGNNFYFPK